MATDTPSFPVEHKVNTGWGNKHLPPGVLFEKLEGWTQRDVRASTPPEVQDLMDRKGVISLYLEFASAVQAAPRVRLVGTLKLDAIAAVLETYAPRFGTAGLAVFLCKKRQYVHGGWVTHKWLEYVDREIDATYMPKEVFTC